MRGWCLISSGLVLVATTWLGTPAGADHANPTPFPDNLFSWLGEDYTLNVVQTESILHQVVTSRSRKYARVFQCVRAPSPSSQ